MAAVPKRRGKKKGLGLKLNVHPTIAEDDSVSAEGTGVAPNSLASLAAAGQLDESVKIGSTTFKAGELKVDRHGEASTCQLAASSQRLGPAVA